jgi:hypothetical protein
MVNPTNKDDDISSVRSSDVAPRSKGDVRCAPAVSFDGISCIELNVLIELVNAFNAESNDKIKLYPNLVTLNPRKYKKYLIRQLMKKNKTCVTQHCWTRQSFVNKMKSNAKSQLKYYTFRPSGPNGKFDWLNTININDVIEQYEIKYKDFKFLGAVPMDFDEIEPLGIRNLDYNDLIKNGKTKIGIVFNLDESWKNGSHWVSFFTDLKKGQIYYFDSYGIQPEPRVRKLMRRIAKYCEMSGVQHVVADHNKIRHQYKHSECGIYSMNFIIRMLQGDTFEQICNSKTTDDAINKYRREYFVNMKV